MARKRKPIFGSWLMRTSALSAAVLITSVPLIVAEKLGAPENAAFALARETSEVEPGAAEITAVPILQLADVDLHAVSVEQFTDGIRAMVDELLADAVDSSDIAVRIGRELGKNFVSGLHAYSGAETETLLANTAIIVGQQMDGALPSMPSWRDLVQLGFDEITAPSAPIGPVRQTASIDIGSLAALFAPPGYTIY